MPAQYDAYGRLIPPEEEAAQNPYLMTPSSASSGSGALGKTVSPPGPGNLPPGNGLVGPIDSSGPNNHYLPTPDDGRPKASAPSPFYFPEFDAPQFKPIEPFSYGAFDYGAFTAPTLQDAQNEPGYDFAKEEGLKALQNHAAAKGILRSGGSLKDFLGWGNRLAEQNFGNVYNRAANTYTLNRNNAADVWGRNRDNAAETWNQTNKQRLDTFENQYRSAKDKFSGKFDAAKLTFDDIYKRWRDILDANTQIATGPGSK